MNIHRSTNERRVAFTVTAFDMEDTYVEDHELKPIDTDTNDSSSIDMNENTTPKTKDPKVKKNRKSSKKAPLKKSVSPREVDILDFLLRGKYIRKGLGATADEIMLGITETSNKAAATDNAEALNNTDDTEIKPLITKYWLYKLLRHLIELGYVKEGIRFELKKTYIITAQGITFYAECFESTQEELAEAAEALSLIRHSWAGKMEELIEQTFPTE